ncbi:MAG: hypothetical protein WBF90_36625 [Rivularia sp. (in: cyanobacteria)]
MNQHFNNYLNFSTGKLKNALPFVSKSLGIFIGLWITWMFCFNQNLEATKALPVAYFFLEAAKTTPESKNDKGKLIAPKEKSQ